MKNILQCHRWIADLDEVLQENGCLNDICGSSVLITGCTGLIGSALADLIIRWNQTHNNRIIIYAAGRNIKRIEARFSPFSQEQWFSFVPYDASSHNNSFSEKYDYIIHGASNATPSSIMQGPVETILDNVLGITELLNYSAKTKARRVLFISSSEVYGKKDRNGPNKVSDHGWIDILNPRSSYSIGKCAAETMCAAYYEEYHVSSVVVRPGHIYGPTATQNDNRVSSVWPRDAARNVDIIMKSDGSQIRSYCYCLDCASAILKVLQDGETGKAYNISNPNSVITIRKMAELLAAAAGISVKTEIPTEKELKAFNPMSDSSLDGSELLALGWRGLFDAERGFSHTVEILKELYLS